MQFSTLDEVAAAARANLPATGFESLFLDPASPNRTWAANLRAFAELALRPRVLCSADELKVATTVLGQPIATPVMIAPAGVQQRMHAGGELASAQGAAQAGTAIALSTLSSFSLAEVAQAGGTRWYQLYLTRDRALALELVREAERTGYGAIVLTVCNVPGLRSVSISSTESQAVSSRREQAFWSAGHADPARMLRVFQNLPESVRPDAGLSLADIAELSPSWSDLDWLVANTRLPVVVKGIQTAEDALLCARHGASAIVVSNHGGASPSLEDVAPVLVEFPRIVAAVEDRMELYLDGGVRHGRDVLKALALGARAVLIGRPALWGLAAGGAEGVAAVVELLTAQLRTAMAITGVADVRAVPREIVTVPFQPALGREFTARGAVSNMQA